MRFKKSDIKKYFIGLGAFWAILLIVYIIRSQKHKEILENPSYTIGSVYELKKYARTEDYYMYNYKIDSEDYQKGIGANSSNNLFIGKSYFVIFEKGKPKNSMLLPFLPVPENITEAPPKGWEELPVPADKEMIRHFLEKY